MPAPSAPFLTLNQATTAGNLGSNQLNFNFQPGDFTNNLFRQSPDGGVICLSRFFESGATFWDFSAQHGVTYRYYGHTQNGAGEVSDVSSPVSAILSLNTAILHEVGKNEQTNNADLTNRTVIELFNQEGQKDTRSRQGKVLIMPALAKPIITTSPIVGRTLSIPILVPNSSIAVFRALRTALKSNALFCYRDAVGTIMHGTFPPQQLEQDINGEANIVMNESDFDENVEAL